MMYSHNLKWYKLKENGCPKCGKFWLKGLEEENEMYIHGCGFKIRKSKYKEIISKQVNQDIDKQYEVGD